jgi:hypothetical protein
MHLFCIWKSSCDLLILNWVTIPDNKFMPSQSISVFDILISDCLEMVTIEHKFICRGRQNIIHLPFRIQKMTCVTWAWCCFWNAWKLWKMLHFWVTIIRCNQTWFYYVILLLFILPLLSYWDLKCHLKLSYWILMFIIFFFNTDSSAWNEGELIFSWASAIFYQNHNKHHKNSIQ